MVTPRKHLNSSLFVLHSSLHLIQRCRIFLRNILLNHQVIDDEVLTFHRILTHIILQELLHLVGLVQRYLLQSHIRTDEMGKLFWRNLSQSLESGDFRVRTQRLDGLLALLIAVAVMRNEVAFLLLRSQLGISIRYSLLVLDFGSDRKSVV